MTDPNGLFWLTVIAPCRAISNPAAKVLATAARRRNSQPGAPAATSGCTYKARYGEGERGLAYGSLAVSVIDGAETALAYLRVHAGAARGAYSTNTERALRADVAIFTRWCADAGSQPLLAEPETVAAFVDAMGEVKAPATVRRYVSSVATFHRAARLPSPADTMEVKLALKRLHRAKGRAQAQASPLTRNLVERMLEAAGAGPRALRNRALLAAAYDTLARRSELVASDRADFQEGPHGDGTLTIRRSKTDQEGAGMVRYLAPDTMREVIAWTAAAAIEDGPLFRSVGKAGAIGGALTAGDVARVFKGMAEAAGISPHVVAATSGHSSRVGAAQDMVRHGVELPAVMQAGGWKPPKWSAAILLGWTRARAGRQSWRCCRTGNEPFRCS